MITTAETLERLQMAATTSQSPCMLAGDVLTGIVRDLESLRKHERATDAAVSRLGRERDDSTPANDEADSAPLVDDGAYLDTEAAKLGAK